jgi:CHAT domain-containing protein
VGAGALRARLGLIRGLCLRARGDVATSRDVLLDAVKQAESVRGSINAEQIRRSYLESAGKLYREAIVSVMLAGDHAQDAQRAAAVFDLSERLRQRTLLDQLTMPEVSGGLLDGGMEHQARAGNGLSSSGWLDEVSREEAAYVQQLNAMYAQIGPAGRGVLSAKHAQTSQRLRELEQAAATCRLAAESKLITRRGMGEPLRLEEFSQRLPHACSVINFVLDGPWISAQVIDRRGSILRREIILIEQAEYLARRLEMALSRAMRMRDADGAALSLAQDIRQRCIGPLEPLLKETKELLIVPAGPLHACPLVAAGGWSESDGARGDRVSTAFRRAEAVAAGCTLAALSPASEILMRRSAEAPRSVRPPRVLLAGVSDAQAPRLEDEVAAVAKHWEQAKVLRGAEASEASLMAELPMADVVHLACHAVFDPEFPGSSRIMLADRWLTTRQIAGRLKPGAVVILAGCNTGRSGDLDGEDRSGFVRSIIAGGASAVLTAMWPLHDESALRLFDAWHAKLAGWTHGAGQGDASGLSDAEFSDGCISGCTSSLILANNLRQIQREAHARGDAFFQWGGLMLTKGL